MTSSHPAWPDLNDSLFVPADDDRQWDEHDYEQAAEDTLGWDSNLVEVCPLSDGRLPVN
jgi:cell cycle checkpoint control protein RAD9A